MESSNFILYLGSKSASRRLLLERSRIPFTVIHQDADEARCDWTLPLPQLVESIARYKMEHIVVPDGSFVGQFCSVLTADSMSHDKWGNIQAKPVSREDAIKKIKAAREGSFLCTAFCLDKRVWNGKSWDIINEHSDIVTAQFVYDVPDHWIDFYLEHTPYMDVSGAIAIEDFGVQFLKTVDGSYSTIIGLPIFQVRQVLDRYGFFNK